jgi:beta-lactamase class A
MLQHRILILLFSFFTCVKISHAQQIVLINNIKTIAQDAKGKVSVAAFCFEDSTSISYFGDELCVMQSSFKFPVAIVVLDRIDKGEFSLQHKIHITPKEMTKDIWSPLRDSLPEGNVNVTFENLLKFMVSHSDNIACDVLLHHLGKPKVVEKFIQKNGIEDFYMKYNEKNMQQKWRRQYKNICSPNAMIQLLTKLYQHQILSRESSAFLYKIMTETSTGKNRIVKLLPQQTIVAHKTGSSGTKDGLTAGVIDVGIITLPNGKHVALAVFVNDAYATYEVLENIIARIAKEVYDEFNQ